MFRKSQHHKTTLVGGRIRKVKTRYGGAITMSYVPSPNVGIIRPEANVVASHGPVAYKAPASMPLLTGAGMTSKQAHRVTHSSQSSRPARKMNVMDEIGRALSMM